MRERRTRSMDAPPAMRAPWKRGEIVRIGRSIAIVVPAVGNIARMVGTMRAGERRWVCLVKNFERGWGEDGVFETEEGVFAGGGGFGWFCFGGGDVCGWWCVVCRGQSKRIKRVVRHGHVQW